MSDLQDDSIGPPVVAWILCSMFAAAPVAGGGWGVTGQLSQGGVPIGPVRLAAGLEQAQAEAILSALQIAHPDGCLVDVALAYMAPPS